MKDVLDRLADKMLVGDGCWEWTACRNSHGYGQVSIDKKMRYAHRVVYELLVGPIPHEQWIDHLCRNPGCVRPDHLEPVSPKENYRRGAGPGGELWDGTHHESARTHCKYGHLLDGQYSNGWRFCRTCHALKLRRLRARRRESAASCGA